MRPFDIHSDVFVTSIELIFVTLLVICDGDWETLVLMSKNSDDLFSDFLRFNLTIENEKCS